MIDNLAACGCAAQGRVVVEKPFGRDLASARGLNVTLLRAFPEESIFRIDHYLGKEAVQNILYFRFANSFLEPVWNRHYVEISPDHDGGEIRRRRPRQVLRRGRRRSATSFRITCCRSSAIWRWKPLRQQHAEAIHDEQAQILRNVRPLSGGKHRARTVQGYRKEAWRRAGFEFPPTPPAISSSIHGVGIRCSFHVRAGKCLSGHLHMRCWSDSGRPPVVFKESLPKDGNYVRFRLSPTVAIAIGARAKRPGEGMTGEPVELSVVEGLEEGPADGSIRARAPDRAMRWLATQPCLPVRTSWRPRGRLSSRSLPATEPGARIRLRKLGAA